MEKLARLYALHVLLDGRASGPIEVPEAFSRRCQVVWSISGVVDRVGKTWRLGEP